MDKKYQLKQKLEALRAKIGQNEAIEMYLMRNMTGGRDEINRKYAKLKRTREERKRLDREFKNASRSFMKLHKPELV